LKEGITDKREETGLLGAGQSLAPLWTRLGRKEGAEGRRKEERWGRKARKEGEEGRKIGEEMTGHT
jgi:hypothetical protein